MLFWAGLLVGILIGGPLGVLVMALCAVRRCDECQLNGQMYRFWGQE